jgi:predicted TIM-barrel fold metal-dependent hydrolase
MRDKNPTEFIRNLDLSPSDRDLILGGNATRLFKI